jgi:hypothetical protein
MMFESFVRYIVLPLLTIIIIVDYDVYFIQPLQIGRYDRFVCNVIGALFFIGVLAFDRMSYLWMIYKYLTKSR